MRLRIFLIGLIVVVLLGVGVAWLERAPLLTWYYLHGLAAASDENRQTWVERVATLDSAAVPGLIERLRQADYVIDNNGDMRSAEIATHRVYEALRAMI